MPRKGRSELLRGRQRGETFEGEGLVEGGCLDAIPEEVAPGDSGEDVQGRALMMPLLQKW